MVIHKTLTLGYIGEVCLGSGWSLSRKRERLVGFSDKPFFLFNYMVLKEKYMQFFKLCYIKNLKYFGKIFFYC